MKIDLGTLTIRRKARELRRQPDLTLSGSAAMLFVDLYTHADDGRLDAGALFKGNLPRRVYQRHMYQQFLVDLGELIGKGYVGADEMTVRIPTRVQTPKQRRQW